ncbi:MAG: hypothetical protein Q9223_005962 [Gallowayella weberi]
MNSTQYASASSSRQEETQQLRQRFARLPIGPPPTREDDTETWSLLHDTSEFEAIIAEAKQLIESNCTTEDLQIARGISCQVDRTGKGEAGPKSKDAEGNKKAPVLRNFSGQTSPPGEAINSTTQQNGDIMPKIPDLSTSESTIQLRITLIFLFMPIWVTIARAIIWIFDWIFLVVEDNRLKRLVRTFDEIIESHEKTIELKRLKLALQKQVFAIIERAGLQAEKEILLVRENAMLASMIECEKKRKILGKNGDKETGEK